MNPPAPRVMFFYDGFNLYHSLERARSVSLVFARESYAKHQLPAAVRLPSDKFVVHPHTWAPPPAA
jgi:hypothetical protein